MITPRDFIAGFIGAHEGVLSVHPADNGNWYDPKRFAAGEPQVRGKGTLVGSQFGVTAYALVNFRLFSGQRRETALVVKRADIAAVTLEKAVEIGLALYYRQPGLDRLVWNRVTASILDKAWGSGPGRAIRMLQQLLDVPDDGVIGARTADAYAALFRPGQRLIGGAEEYAAGLWCAKRIAFDRALGSNEGPNDPDRVFVEGWNNRSRSFLPGTRWWREAGK